MNNAILLKRQVDVEVSLSPDELAMLFWKMNSEGMAQFFNRLGDINNMPMQLQYTTDEEALLPAGRWAMGLIGEYSEKSK